MYAGLRQHLYVLPAIAGLAVLGALALSQAAKKSALLPAAVILALIGPAFDQAALFPYQFVYKNALASPINDRWETDMHWVSAREAVRQAPADATLYCYRNALVAPGRDLRTPTINECKALQVRPFRDEQGEDANKTTESSEGTLWTIARKYRGSPPAPACEPVANVTRNLRGEDVVISYVLLCDSDRYLEDTE